MRKLLLLFILPIFSIVYMYAQTGDIIWERWNSGIGSLTDLQTATNPDETLIRTAIDGPVNYANNYYSRMSGYIFPDETGDYTFYIASDDNSELWLSTDATKANLTNICHVNNWTSHNQWTREGNQQSAPIALQAGNVYYFEAYHREGGGGDNCSVGWEKPSTPGSINVIGSAYISQTAYALMTFNEQTVADDDIQKETSDMVLYKFSMSADAGFGPAEFDSVSVTTAGSYTATGIINFKLWYNPLASTLAGATQLGSTVASAGPGTALEFKGFTQAMSQGETGYLLITADVEAAAVNSNTINISSMPVENVRFTSNTQYTSTTPLPMGGVLTIIDANDKTSDIIENAAFTYPTDIDYLQYLANDITGTGSGDLEIAQFTIQDDATSDGQTTELTSLTLAFDNFYNLKKVAIYDGSTEIAEADADTIVSFNNLSVSVADGGTLDLSVWVSFDSLVIDNEQIEVIIAAASVDGSGSLFAAPDAGGAKTTLGATDNKIMVTATDLVFTTQASTNALFDLPIVTSPVVTAKDANASIDYDFVNDVILTNSDASEMVNDTFTAVAGVAAFSNLIFRTPGMVTLSADGGGLSSSVPSDTVNVVSPLTTSETNAYNGDVGQGTTNRRMLRVEIDATGANQSPITVTKFWFNLAETNNNTDIDQAILYELNTNGSRRQKIGNNSAVDYDTISFTEVVTLNQSRTYEFDLIFDVDLNAVVDDTIDAALDSVEINGLVYVPIVDNGTSIMVVKGGLNGDIVIDPNLTENTFNESYMNWYDAIGDYNKYGVGPGGVNFMFKDDESIQINYNPNYFVLNQTGYADRPVVFTRTNDGSAMPHLHSGNRDRIIECNASYVIFDGLDIEIESNRNAQIGIELQGKHNVVRNCSIDMRNKGHWNQRSCVCVESSGAQTVEASSDHNIVENNVLRRGHRGVYLRCSNGGADVAQKGNIIRNNKVIDFMEVGISSEKQDSVIIANNHIYGASKNSADVTNNNREYAGINVDIRGYGEISGNEIHDIETRYNQTDARIRGILLDNGNASTDVYIYNNMIYDLRADSSPNNNAVIGIVLWDGGTYHLYHNTVHINYTATNDDNGSFALRGDGDQIELKNNLFVNYTKVTGNNAKVYVVDIDPSHVIAGSDYNCYYAGTPDTMHLINYFDNSETMTDYKTNMATVEQNSISDTIVFAAANDGHILQTETDSSIVEQAAQYISAPIEIDVDVDGQKRNPQPDIGADEGNFTGHDVNDPPVMNHPADPAPVFNDEGLQTVILTGIDDGDSLLVQSISFSAISSDISVISNPTVTYTGGDSAELSYTTTGGWDTVMVTVYLKDDGGNQYFGIDSNEYYFDVVIRERKQNHPPTIDAIGDVTRLEDEGEFTVSLTGIADGDDGSQTITISARADNPSAIDNFVVNHSGGSTGSLTIDPERHVNGTIEITVYVGDIVDEVYSEEHMQDSVKFNINISPVNDRPRIYNVDAPDQILDNQGLVTVNLSNIDDGDPEITQNITITASSSDPSIIPDPTVNYSGGTTGTVTFTPVIGQTGNVTITLDLSDDGGTLDGGQNQNSVIFVIEVLEGKVNNPPTIDPVTDVVVNEDETGLVIGLSGISDGDGGIQTLNIEATHDNPSLISSFNLNYPGANVGAINYSLDQNASGTANVKVRIEDVVGFDYTNGPLADSIEFTITVNPINDQPTITTPSDISMDTTLEYSIGLSGIGDGDPDEDQTLQVSASTNNTTAITNLNVDYTTGSTAILTFTPGEVTTTAQITITVTDDGGTANGGIDTREVSFLVDLATGTNIHADEANQLAVYPVPAQNFIHVEIPDVSYKTLIISDISGRDLVQKKVDKNMMQLNIEALTAGTYVISLLGEKEVLKSQFIKQ